MAFTLPALPTPDPRRWWSHLLSMGPRLEAMRLRLRGAALTAAAMPLGSQQLRRQRTSTLLSLAGVTASLIVIFAQLGIERAVYFSAVRIHRAVIADLVLVPQGFKSLQLHANLPFAATDIIESNPAVASTSPLWFDVMPINHSGMTATRQIAWYAIDPERPAIDVPGLRENLYKLRQTRRVLFDRDSRPYYGDLAEVADHGEEIPVRGPPDYRSLLRELFVVGTVSIGPNVINDGNVIMSDATMAEAMGSWYLDRPAFIAIRLVPGSDLDKTRIALNHAMIGRGEVITRQEFESRERAYWARETPVGYITDLGFIMGLMIGMVFIYYAQYQIIRFYLPEYAILKSLGYDWWFFLCMIGQIGAAIITPAYLVAFTLARLVYGAAEATIHLGMAMGLREMVVSLIASLVMTAVSSVFAIRRLWKVDPIMLFE
jgi:putative ABC transport system permease protein